MLAIVSAVVLAVCSAIAFPWQSATLAYGRLIGPEAGPTGMQDALTPAWLTRTQMAYMLAVPATLVLGWLSFAWYWGIALVVAGFVAGAALSKLILPATPTDSRYRQGLVRDLERRRARFEVSGDVMRAQVAEDLLGRLRGDPPPTFGSTLAECERDANAALIAMQRGEIATGALNLLIAFMRAREQLSDGDYSRRSELAAYGAAALKTFEDVPAAQRADWRFKQAVGAFPLDDLRDDVCRALKEHFGDRDCDELIRSVGGRAAATAFSISEIQRLMREV